MRPILPILVAAVAVAWPAPARAQLRIVNYNVNNSDPAAFGPRAGMETVLRGMNASAKGGFARPVDILILEEAESVTSTGTAYAGLLNTIAGGTSYLRSTVDAGSTGSGRPIAVYNSAAVSLVAEKKVGSLSGTASQPRQTMRYQFRPVGYDSAADFYVYASHYKASTGAANEAERNNEARAIRADSDALGQGVSVIYAGDFNFYSSTEAAFQTLTGTGNGQAFDPVSRVGGWSGSSSFKDVHTQSPATVAVFNGQVTGGMDDRFDFQLVTAEADDGRGFDYLPNSYWAFGNTATHAINQAVSSGSAATLAGRIPGYTTAQASSVLTALTQVTDHLPVLADYQLPAKMTATLAAPPPRVIRGASVSGTLTVANAAPVAVAAGADRLDYAFTGSGGFTSSGTGSDAALGGSNTHLLTLSTTAAGLRSGTVSVTSSSPQAATPTFSGTVTTSVLDRAVGSFASATTSSTLALDFGTLIRWGAGASSTFSIFNRPATSGTAWTARLDLDGVTATLPPAVFSTSLAPFVNLASGSSRPFSVSVATATTGSFTGSYALAMSDEDLPGATGQSLAVSIRAIVMQPVAGDLNCDAQVDILDAAGFLGAGLLDTGITASWSQGDFNADAQVDVLDVADFLAADCFDKGDYRPAGAASAVAAVPEPVFAPAIHAVFAAVGIAMLNKRRRRAILAAVAVAGGAFAGPARAGGIIDFGLADEFTLSQPVVQIQVGSFGALDLNEYLLDTGASGILAGANSSAELRAKGLVTEATYVDYGVAGPQSTGVSRPYDFFFAGSDGVPRTLANARMQTSSGDFAFYSGIAGMPLMTGRTVGFNLASQADMNDLRIGVAFDVAYPATPSAHQYSVPLTMVQFPASGQQHPTDPLPENASLPFVPVRAQYGGTTKTGNFLLDTGAQQCILSKAMALDLGLDLNGNGMLDDEALSFQTVAGVGGSVEIPVLRIDALSLRAAGDVELLFRDITVGVIDIDPALPGVLGMNVLNSGWEMYALNTFLGMDPGPPGVFGRIDLDFRPAAALRGEMRLSVDPSRDAFISQGPITVSVASGSPTQGQAGHAAIGGPSGITKTGAGTLVLDAVNTLTGTTVVQGGTVRIAAANALFGSPVVVQPGGRLELATGTSPARVPSVTLAGGTLSAPALVINGSAGIAKLVLAGGQVTGSPTLAVGVAGRVALTAGDTLSVASLAVDEAAGGLIDVGSGRLVVAANGITRAALLADLAAGRAGGDWTGVAGITSSTAAADLAQRVPRSVGWLEAADGSLLVGYAAAGDATVDGVVDILDAARFLAAGRFDTWSPAVWGEGDFNYDGVVDVLDAADFASAGLFDQGAYGPAAPALAFEPAATAVTHAVPEPSGAAAVVMGMGLVMCFRRRFQLACVS
ncbi:MAG: aspartyl protease family protein [Planctomycetaceae bacterium]